MTRHVLRAAAVLALLALAHGSARGRVLDPEAFASLGTLVLANGSFTIDTDLLQIRDDASTILFTGVVDDQDGRADSFDDAASGPLGIPEIAVFTFDSIDVQSTATITLTGSRALALLSKSDATIEAVLDASGANGAGAVAGAGRLGGFAGGTGAMNGVGPGAGGYTRGFGAVSGNQGGSGAFGGAGRTGAGPGANPIGAGGLPYGDLRGVSQGGSGGGGFQEMSGTPNAGGGAGGGALEVGALGALVLGPSGTLRSRGGDAGSVPAPATVRGGAGSGGGVRLHGASLQRQGQVVAPGGTIAGALSGGGGRVVLSGSVLDLTEVAALTVTALTTGVDLTGPNIAPPGFGVLTFVPSLLVVGGGETRALEDIVLQAQSGTAPGVEVSLSDLRVLGLAEVSVPAAGATNEAKIGLGVEEASITGPGVLTNAGRLAGPGRVQAPLVNASGGRVEVIGGSLDFDATVVNQPGGSIDALDATLDFMPSGLANSGALRLVDATVAGTVVNAAGATPAVGGTSIFTGAVSGPASFAGTGTVVFAGSYAPGASPAQVGFPGNVVFAAGSMLTLEIAGSVPGAGYDRIDVAGTATLGGTLDLVLSVEPIAGQAFDVLSHGVRAGEFAAVTGVQATPTLDLALAYGPGTTRLTAVRRGAVDFDGDVDADDQAVVQANSGAITTDYARGDVNGDGAVDAVDQGIVVAAAGTPIPTLSRAGAALLATLLVAGALAIHRARRLPA